MSFPNNPTVGQEVFIGQSLFEYTTKGQWKLKSQESVSVSYKPEPKQPKQEFFIEDTEGYKELERRTSLNSNAIQDLFGAIADIRKGVENIFVASVEHTQALKSLNENKPDYSNEFREVGKLIEHIESRLSELEKEATSIITTESVRDVEYGTRWININEPNYKIRFAKAICDSVICTVYDNQVHFTYLNKKQSFWQKIGLVAKDKTPNSFKVFVIGESL